MKNVIAYLGGVVTGGIIAYIHYSIKSKKDIQNIQEYYKKRLEIKADKNNNDIEKDLKETDTEESSTSNNDVDYCQYYKGDKQTEEPVYVSASEDDYYGMEDGNTRSSATWYSDDKLMDDSTHELITITDQLNKIKYNDADSVYSDTFYFINDTKNIMYEVTIEDTSYDDYMEGATESDNDV